MKRPGEIHSQASNMRPLKTVEQGCKPDLKNYAVVRTFDSNVEIMTFDIFGERCLKLFVRTASG